MLRSSSSNVCACTSSLFCPDLSGRGSKLRSGQYRNLRRWDAIAPALPLCVDDDHPICRSKSVFISIERLLSSSVVRRHRRSLIDIVLYIYIYRLPSNELEKFTFPILQRHAIDGGAYETGKLSPDLFISFSFWDPFTLSSGIGGRGWSCRTITAPNEVLTSVQNKVVNTKWITYSV